ncbi:MAG: hypothetical protein FJZ57_06305 [Chlamydiae bacterium]|nr:hypothetical protein [Chlamydiota bacterium]
MKRPIQLIIYLAMFALTERACYLATAGFRQDKILSMSKTTNKEEQISEQRLVELNSILDQNYYYLGKGGCCYCFCSADDKYVIKFFKQHHLTQTHFLASLPLPNFLEQWRKDFISKKEKQLKHKRKDYLFTSIKIAQDLMSKETGIVHAQLNPSEAFARKLIFFDKIGVKHSIDLSNTEFVIQKKVTLIYSYLNDLIKNNEIDQAKRALDSLISHIQNRCKKGIHDRDPHPTINFGYLNGEAIELDLGSFSMDKSLSQEEKVKSEVLKILLSVHKKLIRFKWNELANYVELQRQKIENENENSV